MKYIDKLISEYKEAIKDHYTSHKSEDVSFFASKYFDYGEFLEEYLEITDITDRFIFLKFIHYEVEKENDNISRSLKSNQRQLKTDWINEKQHEDVKKILKSDIPRYKFYLPTLKEISKLISIEINELTLLLNFKNENKNLQGNENTNQKESKHLKQKEIKNVQWRGNDTELYYLINQLEKSGLFTAIDSKSFLKIIEEYFIDKNGKPFSKKSITQGKNNIIINKDKKSRNSHTMDKILEEFKNVL